MEYIVVRRVRQQEALRKRAETLSLHMRLRDISNPFSNSRFRSMYRLTPDMALALIEDLKPLFKAAVILTALPVELKVLAALHFYGQASYQKPDGRDSSINMSQASISRSIQETTMALNSPSILQKWIVFPINENKRQEIVQKNYRRFHIPGVLGYVDGTHVLIQKPALHEDLYINRKGNHSLNVQMVCDSELIILNVVAKYPGSTHDAFVWRSSTVREKMVQLSADFWLLGDSGYPLEPWLLTPILNAASNSREAQFTDMHIKSRNCIERCFGVLKARFRCLHRVLEYAPTKVGHIANACAVLHNMCIKAGLPEPLLDSDDDTLDPDHEESPISSVGDLHERGNSVRINLINRLF